MGVILSWDRTTPGESFSPGIERLQGSHSVLGWNDSRGGIQSWNGTTPGNHSDLGYNGSWVVIPFQDRRTPGESFRPRKEQLRASQAVLVKRILWSPSVLA